MVGEFVEEKKKAMKKDHKLDYPLKEKVELSELSVEKEHFGDGEKKARTN